MSPKIRQMNEEEIIKLFDSGLTQKELVERFNTCHTVIRRIIKNAGIDTRLNSKAPMEVDAEIWKQIQEYRKISEISEDLNVTRDVIRRVAKNHGIDAVEFRNNHFRQAIIELNQKGMFGKDIKETLPVSVTFINKIVDENSLSTKAKKKAENVLELFDKGDGVVKIAGDLQMSTRTVHKILRKNGLEEEL